MLGVVLLAQALGGCWIIAFDAEPDTTRLREKREASEKKEKETEEERRKNARTFTRIAIEPDGRIRVGFEDLVVTRAEDVPVPEGEGLHWLTTQSAPTPAAMTALTVLAEVADARGWFMVSRVIPAQPGQPIRTPDPMKKSKGREKPPELVVAEVLGDGSVVIAGFTAEPSAARTLLPGKECGKDQAVALKPKGATHRELFRAAGFFAAAGCEVMVVQRPPGAPEPPIP